MALSNSIFFEKHGVTTRDLETYLAEALSRGGDYADIYFEYRINHSIVLEEQIIKSATKSINIGAGVRVISGEKTGYAYSDSLERDHILKAARTAAFIANASSEGGTIGVPAPSGYEHGFYSTPAVPAALDIAEKTILRDEADQAARFYDARIHQVQASCLDETRLALIATHDEPGSGDLQPLAPLSV